MDEKEPDDLGRPAPSLFGGPWPALGRALAASSLRTAAEDGERYPERSGVGLAEGSPGSGMRCAQVP